MKLSPLLLMNLRIGQNAVVCKILAANIRLNEAHTGTATFMRTRSRREGVGAGSEPGRVGLERFVGSKGGMPSDWHS